MLGEAERTSSGSRRNQTLRKPHPEAGRGRCRFVEDGVRLRSHDSRVPRISEFYGIAIAMYYAEHGVAHVHAVYAGQDASIAVDTLEVLAGSLPDRALRLVREWAELHGPNSRRTGGAPAKVGR
jgi:hypothetical protein